jgi:nicotinamidase-related amidase
MSVVAFGKSIPTSVDDLLDSRCAVVVWDMQEGIARRSHAFEQTIVNIGRIADAARRRGLLVIYAQHTELPLEAEAPAFIRTQWRRSGLPLPDRLQRPMLHGSAAWQIIPELAPQAGDVLLQKFRISFFAGTPLAEILAANRVETLVLTGVATDRGVLSTARDAADNYGLFPMVVADACAAFTVDEHEQAVQDVQAFADLCTTKEVLGRWQATS